VINHDPANVGLASNDDMQILAGSFERISQASHPSGNISPDTARTSGFAHDVMQQYVGGSRHRWRGKRTDDRIGRQCGSQDLRFEPAF
jgi:hypothetical protein